MARHGWMQRAAAVLALLASATALAGSTSVPPSSAPGGALPCIACCGDGARRRLLQAAAPAAHLGAPVAADRGDLIVPAPAPAPAQPRVTAQWLHMVYQLFGPNIEPFTEALRQDFVQQLNWTLVEVDLQDIEILSVEEFLPLTGPKAETLMRLSASPTKHAELSGAVLAAAPGPDVRTTNTTTTASYLRSVTGRRLLQDPVGPQPAPGRASVTPASAAEPHVQVTLRISTDSGESWHVVQEVVTGAAPGGPLLWCLQQAGMGVTRLLLASHILYNCGDADDAQCLTTVERTSAGLPSGTAPPAAALPVGSAPAPPRLHALLAGSDATTSPHALSNTAIGLIAGVCMLALLVAAALASLATRRARLIQAERGAEEGRWAPGSLRGKLGRAGTEPSLSGTEPPGVAGAPSSANSRSAGGSLASSLDAEAGGLPAYILNPVGSALARSTWGSGLYPATPSAGGRIATPFSVGSSASLAHAATSNPLHAGGADAAAGGGALTLRRADALSCSPASSGRSGGGGEGEDPAPGAGAWAGEPWRFGGAGGGELISFADLQFSRCIGQGSFGRVFLGKWRETTVAIKLHNEPGVAPGADFWDAPDPAALPAAQRPKVDEQLLEGLRREAGLMAALRHPNVVLFLGACPEPPCMVTAFCARGSLLDVLARARASPAAAADLGWGRRLALALEAAKGMLYLHSRAPPVLHRDLKSANLLVDKDWHARLADFNLSRVMDSALGGPESMAARRATSAAASIAATNPRWLAPEVLAGRSYDCSCDVYSFGIILWELLTWRVPWEDYEGPWQVVIAVVDRGLRPEVPPPCALPTQPLRQHDAYVALMRRCWATDPAQRPAFDAVICELRAIVDAEVLAHEQLRRGGGADGAGPPGGQG